MRLIAAGTHKKRPLSGLPATGKYAVRIRKATLLASALSVLVSCSGINTQIRNLGKSDVDLVSDIHILTLRDHLQELALKLYEKNPGELGKVPGISLEARLAQILDHPTGILYRELDYRHSVSAVNLAFDHGYRGDRVFALLLGISSMLKLSYNDLDELFLFDKLDPQKLYNSARNLEKIAWRLRAETRFGKPLMELGPVQGQGSFEDTIIRMVSIQDLMAEIIASKTQRAINKAVQSATTILIPIGL